MRKRQWDYIGYTAIALFVACVATMAALEIQLRREKEQARIKYEHVRTRALERCMKLGGVLVRFHEPRFRCLKRDLFLGE